MHPSKTILPCWGNNGRRRTRQKWALCIAADAGNSQTGERQGQKKKKGMKEMEQVKEKSYVSRRRRSIVCGG
jgi:hypothetical protein